MKVESMNDRRGTGSQDRNLNPLLPFLGFMSSTQDYSDSVKRQEEPFLEPSWTDLDP